MKTVLITGGAGYIGSHTAKEFAEHGYKIIVLDNLINGHKDFVKWGKFIEGDIGDSELLEFIFNKYQIDLVSHFAAFADIEESVRTPYKYYENNVVKALNLLHNAVNGNVKVFQFSSSCATYGHSVQLPITESHQQRPLNPYGKSKLFFEKILRDCSNSSQIRYSILRYFNAAGADPDMDVGEDHRPETHLIPLILSAASGSKAAIEIYGTDYDTTDGTCIRDYVHVTDLAIAHVLAAEKTFSNGNTIYNLGNGEGFSVKDVIEKVRQVTGRHINVIEKSRRAGDPDELICSSEKIISELGWQPKYASLYDIIETAWLWYQKRNA